MRITTEAGYSDIYSDLYGGTVGDVILHLECAFSTDPAETPVWEDITPYLRSYSFSRGYTAGTATFVLDNQDRRFDPTHTGGPYYPNVVPMRRIRLRATYNGTTYDRFSGYVDGWPQRYINPNDGYVEVNATDAFKVLSMARLPDSVYDLEVRTDAPIGYWRLSEDEGSLIAGDAMGNFHLSVIDVDFGAQSLIVKDSGGAGAFNGQTSRAVSTAPIPVENVFAGGAASIEAWVVPEDMAGYGDICGIEVNDGNHIILRFNGATGVFEFAFGNGFVQEIVEGTSTVYAGNRYHVVGTYDFDDTTGRLYVNGVQEGTESATALIASGTFWIGANPNNLAAAFHGVIDEVAVYQSSSLSATRVLAHYNAGSFPWYGDSTSERITRILDEIDWPASLRDIATGDSELQSTALNERALSYLQKIEVSEAGGLFITAGGVLKFRNRHAMLATPYTVSQNTWGDSGSELRYRDITPDEDDSEIRNEIVASREGGGTYTVSDQDSIDRYGLHSDEITGLMLIDDNEVVSRANWRLDHYKDPFLRFTSMEIRPAREPATLMPAVLEAELGDRQTVKRRPQGVGSAISQDVHLEGIKESVSATDQTWITNFELSPAETRTYWIVGDATYGVVGTTTIPAY